MNKRVIQHEVKLGKSLKIILAVLAIGVLLNAFSPMFSAKNAFAELGYGDRLKLELSGAVDIS
ncbi:MAG: hypothetical protein QGI90_09320 [Nitrospinaceae bacterium]|jgi:hypothetical protein|nr:hypothetical protein [Nitrospinota bacterium]MDP6336442.1 hypothetical protein [Nitrospinaceae bacterium]MDP7148875.1 hypothetical protein [Nitrospinaceae bacterium]